MQLFYQMCHISWSISEVHSIYDGRVMRTVRCRSYQSSLSWLALAVLLQLLAVYTVRCAPLIRILPSPLSYVVGYECYGCTRHIHGVSASFPSPPFCPSRSAVCETANETVLLSTSYRRGKLLFDLSAPPTFKAH